MTTKQEEEHAAAAKKKELAAAALEEARRHAPLDLLMEVVEYRYQQRRKQDRRWWIGLVVAVFTAYVAAGAFFVAIVGSGVENAETTASRAEAVANTANRRQDTPQQQALPPAEIVAGGESQTVQLRSTERARFRISGVQDGTYTFDAFASGEDFDPVLYLYEQAGSRDIILASDDDGGDDLNSLIVEDLRAAGTYFVEVEEIARAPGSVTLSVQPVPSQGQPEEQVR